MKILKINEKNYFYPKITFLERNATHINKPKFPPGKAQGPQSPDEDFLFP